MFSEELNIPMDDSVEEVAILRRYENMRRHNRSEYFEEDEFELIIDYYMQNENEEEALQAVNLGCRLYPFSPEIKLKHAQILLQQGNTEPALQLLQMVESSALSNPELFFLKGIAATQTGDMESALYYFEKCEHISYGEDRVLYWMNIAAGLIGMEAYAQALPFIEKALLEASDDLELINDAAFCYERLGMLKKSIELYECYVKQDPYNAGAWYNLGTVYARQHEYAQAAQAFQFSITLDEKNTSAYYNLATTFTQQEKYEEAIETYNQFLQLENIKEDEAPWAAYIAIGECYNCLNRYNEALIPLLKAVELNPNLAETYFSLSIAFFNTKRYEEALEYIRQAVLINNKVAAYWSMMGRVLMELDRSEIALNVLEHAVILDAKEIDAWLGIADIVSEIHAEKAINILTAAYRDNAEEPIISYRLAVFHFIAEHDMAWREWLERAWELNKDMIEHFFVDCAAALELPELKEKIDYYNKKKDEKND